MCLRSPLPSGHPTVLKTDLPEAALCPGTSAGPGVGPEPNPQVLTMSQSLRERSLQEKPRTFSATENFRMGMSPQLPPSGERTTAAQRENMVNSSLWFIEIVTPGSSLECIFSQFCLLPSLKSCGLKNRIETQWRPLNLLSS